MENVVWTRNFRPDYVGRHRCLPQGQVKHYWLLCNLWSIYVQVLRSSKSIALKGSRDHFLYHSLRLLLTFFPVLQRIQQRKDAKSHLYLQRWCRRLNASVSNWLRAWAAEQDLPRWVRLAIRFKLGRREQRTQQQVLLATQDYSCDCEQESSSTILPANHEQWSAVHRQSSTRNLRWSRLRRAVRGCWWQIWLFPSTSFSHLGKCQAYSLLRSGKLVQHQQDGHS